MSPGWVLIIMLFKNCERLSPNLIDPSDQRGGNDSARNRRAVDTKRLITHSLRGFYSFLMSKAHTQAAAQPAVAADRFAREIVGFLKAFPARSRQLNGKPLGGDHQPSSIRRANADLQITPLHVHLFQNILSRFHAQTIPLVGIPGTELISIIARSGILWQRTFRRPARSLELPLAPRTWANAMFSFR